MNQSIRSIFSKKARTVVVGMIVFYQRGLSPIKNALFGPSGCCRFYPTCSNYALRSVKRHGPVKGLFYSLVRLSKCHPFHQGGYDPVKPVVSRFQPLSEPESLADLRGNS